MRSSNEPRANDRVLVPRGIRSNFLLESVWPVRSAPAEWQQSARLSHPAAVTPARTDAPKPPSASAAKIVSVGWLAELRGRVASQFCRATRLARRRGRTAIAASRFHDTVGGR